MRRIGITASRIAQGNLLFYNLFVVLIAFLFSLLIFVISALVIVLGLFAISSVMGLPHVFDLKAGATSPLSACMIFLAVITLVFNLYAIGMNIKLKQF
jgi:hypothetical protein